LFLIFYVLLQVYRQKYVHDTTSYIVPLKIDRWGCSYV